MFGNTRKLRLIDSNPIIDVEISKHVREPGKALIRKQEEKLLQAIENSKHKNIYMFQLYSGCRPGTPYRIKKEHIDYDDGAPGGYTF
jgi:integrase